MISIWRNTEEDKKLVNLEQPQKGCWINLSNPTEDEIKNTVNMTGVDEGLLRYAFDSDETSHIDDDDTSLLVIINVPYVDKNKKGGKVYKTTPVGLIVSDDEYIITVCSKKIDAFDSLIKKDSIVGEIATYKKTRLIFQIMYIVAVEFLKYLKYISIDMDAFEDNLTKSMKNNELIKLINYQKAMIYFNTSLKTNQSVMERLRRGKFLKLYEEDEDILEDAVIENRQALEMAATYSEILNGMTDIFGTVVSNNLNNVMKFLTSITLIISVPTLIASILGMNVVFPFNTGLVGFWGVMAFTVAITVIVTLWLKNKDMLK